MVDPEPEKGSVFRWAWIFYLILALAGIVWLGIRHGTISSSLFISARSWPIDLGVGLAAGAALSAGWELSRRLLPQARAIEKYFGEILGPMSVSEALTLAVLSAIAEEFFFRGAVQDAFGFLPAAALFTVLHLGPGRDLRLWTLFAAVSGLVLGGLMVWRGTLLAPIIAHALVNGIGLSRLVAAAESDSGE